MSSTCMKQGQRSTYYTHMVGGFTKENFAIASRIVHLAVYKELGAECLTGWFLNSKGGTVLPRAREAAGAEWAVRSLPLRPPPHRQHGQKLCRQGTLCTFEFVFPPL